MFPAAFGRAIRNFHKHCHEFSGEEWKQQATLFLPVYLKEELPGSHYNAFCKLVEAIGILITYPNTLWTFPSYCTGADSGTIHRAGYQDGSDVR